MNGTPHSNPRISKLDLTPILRKAGARHEIHIGSLITRLGTSSELRSNNISEIKIVQRNKNQFILHFKSANFRNKPVANGLFLATFANDRLRDLELLGVTKSFSSHAAYYVHFNTLYIFHFCVHSRTAPNGRGPVRGLGQPAHALGDQLFGERGVPSQAGVRGDQ